jgi:hypothetical protein
MGVWETTFSRNWQCEPGWPLKVLVRGGVVLGTPRRSSAHTGGAKKAAGVESLTRLGRERGRRWRGELRSMEQCEGMSKNA